MAGELVMSMSYGIDVLPSNDPYITLARDALHTFSVANTPGRYLVVSPIQKTMHSSVEVLMNCDVRINSPS
jgi:high-affinity K+ transport system ATPase subunit B